MVYSPRMVLVLFVLNREMAACPSVKARAQAGRFAVGSLGLLTCRFLPLPPTPTLTRPAQPGPPAALPLGAHSNRSYWFRAFRRDDHFTTTKSTVACVLHTSAWRAGDSCSLRRKLLEASDLRCAPSPPGGDKAPPRLARRSPRLPPGSTGRLW